MTICRILTPRIVHALGCAAWLVAPAAFSQFATDELIFDQPQNKTYRVEAELGKGGFAKVFLVKEVASGTRVALKIFQSADKSAIATSTYSVMDGLFDEPGAKEYLVETSAPQVLHDAEGNKWQGQFVELMSGVSLQDVASHFDLTKSNKRDTAAKKVEALAHLQKQMIEAQLVISSHDLVHNDVKPSNYLVSKFDGVFNLDRFVQGDMHVELADFDTISKAKAPMAAGTAAFMPPEKILNPARGSDVVMDLYAVGATLYEVAFGTSYAVDYLASQGLAPGASEVLALAVGDPGTKRKFVEGRFNDLKARPEIRDLGPEVVAKLAAFESLVTDALEPDYARRAATLAKQSSLTTLRAHLEAEAASPATSPSVSVCQRLQLKYDSTILN